LDREKAAQAAGKFSSLKTEIVSLRFGGTWDAYSGLKPIIVRAYDGPSNLLFAIASLEKMR